MDYKKVLFIYLEFLFSDFRTKASLKQHTSTNHRTPAHTLLINW